MKEEITKNPKFAGMTDSEVYNQFRDALFRGREWERKEELKDECNARGLLKGAKHWRLFWESAKDHPWIRRRTLKERLHSLSR